MPNEDWIQHWKVAQFLHDWQTLIAGLFAVAAAWRTIRATVRSADREVAASQAQTAVAQKQIETTIELARQRQASEARAFRTMLEAAMTRVLFEAAWARKTYPDILAQTAGASPQALIIRECITKGAFPELRAACVRQGGPLTLDFLYLEGEIDNLALQYEERSSPTAPAGQRLGKHAGLSDQLAVIIEKATELRAKAARDAHDLTLPGRHEQA
jgi:hypothetical protein